MAQKVATALKMKFRQETTSLDQIATVTAKPTIINTDTRRFKIQTGDMGPPLGRTSNIQKKKLQNLTWWENIPLQSSIQIS